MTLNHARVLMACMALAACDGASTHDMTAPDGDGPSTATGRYRVVRANGEVFSARSAPATPGAKPFEPGVRAAVTAAAATTTVCDAGVIDPVDGNPEGGLEGGTYTDIEVPPGAICVLYGVTVTQSVKALADSRLFIQNSQIGGNVRGLNASAVQVSEETTITGNMNVQGAHDLMFASCAVDNATIMGDLTCADNSPGSPIIRAEQGPTVIGGSVKLVDNVIPAGHVLLLLNASVGADADIRRNTGAGFKSVNSNTVTGELVCKKNDPTFTGGPNTAGTIKGECF
jgi:hypothetical protein